MDGDPNNFDNAVAFVRKVCAPFLCASIGNLLDLDFLLLLFAERRCLCAQCFEDRYHDRGQKKLYVHVTCATESDNVAEVRQTRCAHADTWGRG